MSQVPVKLANTCELWVDTPNGPVYESSQVDNRMIPVVPLSALREWLKEKADHYRDLSTISAQQGNEMLRESQFDKASILYTTLASLGEQ